MQHDAAEDALSDDAPNPGTQTPDQQLAAWWSAVSAEPYPEGALPKRVPGAWGRRRLFSVAYNKGSFEHRGEELPAGRAKLIHTYGSCATVRLEIDDARGFTGILASGGAGLLRLSDAAGGKRVMAAVAIKFPIAGGAPVSYLASPYTRDRVKHWLRTVVANSLVAPESLPEKLLARKFQATAESLGGARLYGSYLPLHHLAEVTQAGERVASPVVADRIELHATDAAVAAAGTDGDWREQLARIPTGTTLYEARVSPKIDLPAEPLGRVVLTSAFVASAYGDERLFFRHAVGPLKG